MDWFIFALGAAFLASIAAIINKKVLIKEHATEFSATFALIIVLVSLVLTPWVEFNLNGRIWFLILLSAVFASIGFLSIIKALRHMDISIVSPLRNFGPAILLIIAFIVLGEKVVPLQILGILILVLGAYILEIDFKKHDILEPIRHICKSKHIHLIFLSLFAYAISSVIGKYVLNFVKPVTLLFYEQIFIAIIFLVILSIKFNGISGLKHGFKNFGWLILIAAILTVSYRFLQNQAFSMTLVSLVIPIKRLDTLFSTLIGGEILKEHGLKSRIMACIIMIIGATMIVLG